MFPISRDPPEGGTCATVDDFYTEDFEFPISRDPPEGGTSPVKSTIGAGLMFPISRDPPEGGTSKPAEPKPVPELVSNF